LLEYNLLRVAVKIDNSNKKGRLCIVAPYDKNVIGDIARIYGNILTEYKFDCIYVNSKPFFKIKMLKDLLINKKNYDFIHVHTSGLLDDIPLIWTYIISKLLKKRYIITYHCGSPDRILKVTSSFINIFFNSADLVTVPSNYSREIILKYNLKISNKLIVLPNLLDESKFKSRKIEKDCYMVITVSSINKWYIYRKGLKLFVEAAKYLPEYKFYIIGKYDKSIEILKKISPENVHFTGYVSEEQLIQFYNSAAVYCQLSVSESFGYALAEAMLCGCIPVVTKNASLPEVVDDSGYYVDELTPKNIAEKIKCSAGSDKSDLAIKRILNHFSVQKKKGDINKIFTQLCRR